MNFTAKLPVFRTDGQKDKWDRYGTYYGRRVPPFLNPLVDKLRKKLKKQKVNFTEVSDGEFITFTAIDKATKGA